MKRFTFIECARKRCGFILNKEEYAEKRTSSMSTRKICPLCHGESFFTLSAQGVRMTMGERQIHDENFPEGLLPEEFVPHPKLTDKRKHAIIEARQRAIKSMQNENQNCCGEQKECCQAGSQLECEIVFLKTRRKQIDVEIQAIKAVPATRERSLAITKLQEAAMWLGMDLKRINEANPELCPNPYPSSKDPSTGSVIEPTADGLKL